MKLFNGIVAVASFLLVVAAAPTEQPDNSLATRTPGPFLDDVHSLATPLVVRGENYCSPTGKGTCNFWLKSSIPLGGIGLQRWWGLYNNACRKIGGSDSSLGAGKTHWSLASELPYKVELDIPSGGFHPQGAIWYAGRKTDFTGMYCETCSGISAARCCRVGFLCD